MRLKFQVPPTYVVPFSKLISDFFVNSNFFKSEFLVQSYASLIGQCHARVGVVETALAKYVEKMLIQFGAETLIAFFF